MSRKTHSERSYIMTRKFEKAAKPETEYRPPAFIAYHVDERGKKKFWTRIGAAWRHQKGDGLTLRLDLLPATGGRIVLRAPSETPDEEAGA
ncbi:hypothetical protein Xaut_0539 [Xanthobacter versatilis]|uniref:Uncharacterized protein n=1 Tax=Xanthobacter autotrophicus (strain ATCC BAA-1158 / Py2) TaxID=78245 RepID=A7ICQ2_XANP2|nr:hypothetical protein Xaut_0539 [Xanthobacter autotrophicus Py2]